MDEMWGTIFKFTIIVLVVGVVLTLFYMAFDMYSTTSSVGNIGRLSSNIQSMYTGQHDFSSLSNVMSTRPKAVVPASMMSGTSVVNQWGGTVTVAPDSNPAMFDISTANVPAKACVQLVTKLKPIGITVNSTALTMPVDAGSAAVACSSDSNNSLTFVFAGS